MRLAACLNAAVLVILLVLLALMLAGCTVNAHVDKRVFQLTAVHVHNDAKSSVGSASAPTTVNVPGTVTNTSETKTEAEQAVDGTLSLPLLP
jgi:uncharacterized lipoprotein YmbA